MSTLIRMQRSYPTSCHNVIYMLFLLPHDIWSSSKLTSLSRRRDSNSWLTLNLSMVMHFLIWLTRGAQRYLSQIERGKSHLDWPCHTVCFLANPKTTFITTQLHSSIWWLLSQTMPFSSNYTLINMMEICFQSSYRFIYDGNMFPIQYYVYFKVHRPSPQDLREFARRVLHNPLTCTPGWAPSQVSVHESTFECSRGGSNPWLECFGTWDALCRVWDIWNLIFVKWRFWVLTETTIS